MSDNKDDQKQKPSISPSLIASSTAGAVSITASYPFDLIKTRMQFKSTDGIKLSMINATKLIYNEGYTRNVLKIRPISGIMSYYRGLEHALPDAVAKSLLRFYTFDKSNELYKKYIIGDENAKMKMHQTLLCGMSAGVVESVLIVQPCERGKVLRAAYINPYKIYADIIYRHGITAGISSLYTGLSSTLARQVGNQATTFTVFYEAKKRVLENTGNTELANYQRLGLGFLGGVSACAITMPFDVSKSVTQMNTDKSISMTEAIKQIYQRNGIRGLYTGMVPRMLRVGLDRAFMFWAYDFISEKIKNWF